MTHYTRAIEIEEKLHLIRDGLDEIIGDKELEEIVSKRNLKLYWGTAPTGRPHIGYLKPLLKIAQFVQADCEVTILFADLHAYLDSMKSSLDQLKSRTLYYEILIKSVLEELGVNSDKVKFVRGTSYQLTDNYNFDKYKLMSLMSLRDAMKAGTEVVKQTKNPKVASLLYPGLQALDEQYLDVDAQFGGVDQRKIFIMAQEYLPKLGYKKRIHLMNPIIPSLKSSGNNDVKMSSSEDQTKVDLLDTPKRIRKKIGKAFCEDGNPQCGLMDFVKHVLFPINILRRGSGVFHIDRPEQYGGNIQYETFEELISDFTQKKLSSVDLKSGVSQWLIQLLENTRNKLFHDEKFLKIVAEAY